MAGQLAHEHKKTWTLAYPGGEGELAIAGLPLRLGRGPGVDLRAALGPGDQTVPPAPHVIGRFFHPDRRLSAQSYY